MASPSTESSLVALAADLSGGSVSIHSPGLEWQVAAALRWARRYCQWHVWPRRAEQIVVDGSGSEVLHLPSLRVVSIESVTEAPGWRDSSPAADPVELAEGRDFTWSASGMLRRRAGRWTGEFRGVTVSLTHGFDAEEVPDVLGVVAQAAARSTTLAGGEIARVGAIGFQSTPGAAAAGGSVFLASEYAVLDQYRLNGVV